MYNKAHSNFRHQSQILTSHRKQFRLKIIFDRLLKVPYALYNFREGILKTAKGLVANTKKLVMGAGSSQDDLAMAAKESVSSITSLAEFIKKGAGSLGSHQSEAQVRRIQRPL